MNTGHICLKMLPSQLHRMTSQMYSSQPNSRCQKLCYHSWHGKEKPQVHFKSDTLNIKDKLCLTEARKTLAAARKSSVFPPVQDPI